MEKKEKKCYYLKDIEFLCYIDTKGNVGVVPFVYNANQTAIKNLNTNEVVSLDDFSISKDLKIAKVLGIDSKHCKVKKDQEVLTSILRSTPYILVSKELKSCIYFPYPSQRGLIDDKLLMSFAERKLMTSKDLEKYSKKISKIYEKENKDVIKNVKQNCVEDTRNF